MDEVPQDVDGEELDLPLNQEPGTAAPQIEINYEIERANEERGNREREHMPGSDREPDTISGITIAARWSGGQMAEKMTDRDEEKARPRGDVGKGETGVPPGEQGISNREGDAADDEDEFEEDDDSEDDSEEEQDDTSLG